MLRIMGIGGMTSIAVNELSEGDRVGFAVAAALTLCTVLLALARRQPRRPSADGGIVGHDDAQLRGETGREL
jgi:hypothetical protein